LIPSQPVPGTYDVFVSYRHTEPDESWVRTVLVPAFDARGLAVCVDYRSFELGATIIESMAAAVQYSRYTVAVMSPQFFDSGFTTLERVMAQHLGLAERNRRLIGLLLRECVMPLELRPFIRLDVSQVSSSAAPELERLCGTLRTPVDG
jgi:hypothetical protein